MWLLPLFQSPAKCALIAGITGQDGCYLEEWLLAQGYEVQPGGCYYLATQSFVSYSFDDEFSTLNGNINGTHFLLSPRKTLTPHLPLLLRGIERDVRPGGDRPAERKYAIPPPLLLRD